MDFPLVFLLALCLSYATSKEDFYGDIDVQNFKHPNSTLVMGTRNIIIDKYFTQNELKELLDRLVVENRDILKVTSLGQSAADNADIWAVQISRNVRQKERELEKPMFKFVANLHGDEAVGYALLVSLIQYLVYGYNEVPRVTNILHNTDVWIVPTLNPDGLKRSKEGRCDSAHDKKGRLNGKGVDLDRNIDKVLRGRPADEHRSESDNVMDFIEKNPFVLSGNMQGGAVVASYPKDLVNMGRAEESLDEKIFKKLAADYARRNSRIAPGTACDESFPGGITAANQNEELGSAMQNFNLVKSNCFELNLFLSCCKYPRSEFLPFYWHENLDAMLNLIESTRRGIFGRVMDKNGRPVGEAVIRLVDNPKGGAEINHKEIKGTLRGEYWRLLVPGDYSVTASAERYTSQTLSVQVTDEKPYVKLDFELNLTGVFGTVTDKYYALPLREALIKVAKISSNSPFFMCSKVEDVIKEFQVDDKANFWMPVEPGRYKITVTVARYAVQSKTVTLTKKKPFAPCHFAMKRQD